MKRVGLLGGMTCESSVEYYRLINEGVRTKLGGIHSAESIMVSVDFGEIQPLMETADWAGVLRHLVEASTRVERAGADFLVICTNTMHKLADQIAAEVSLPLLNIIDATAAEIKKLDLSTVGLLGTRFTMTQDFYSERLAELHGIKTIIPTSEEIAEIHRVIMKELTVGRIEPSSNARYWTIMRNLQQRGAEGMVLGCTEIPLLVKQEEGDIPLFDTTAIHAAAAVDWAIA